MALGSWPRVAEPERPIRLPLTYPKGSDLGSETFAGIRVEMMSYHWAQGQTRLSFETSDHPRTIHEI